MRKSTFDPTGTVVGVSAAIITAVLTALAVNVILRIMHGDFAIKPRETFAGVLAVQSLDLAVVGISALVMSFLVLAPVFVVTAALGLPRLSHAIYAGLVGGVILFAIAAARLPELAGGQLLRLAFVQIPMALAASLAFHYCSRR